MSDVEKGGFISKVIGPKRRWRKYKARVRQLPPNYRAAVDAIERYLMNFVPTSGDSAASMFDDLADLFEQAAADGTPIREIVGEDPVEFVEAFVQNYSQGGYASTRVRKRLTDAIARAEEDGPR
jgi:DNA-binding ferritin-like protein (Dps family)